MQWYIFFKCFCCFKLCGIIIQIRLFYSILCSGILWNMWIDSLETKTEQYFRFSWVCRCYINCYKIIQFCTVGSLWLVNHNLKLQTMLWFTQILHSGTRFSCSYTFFSRNKLEADNKPFRNRFPLPLLFKCKAVICLHNHPPKMEKLPCLVGIDLLLGSRQ